MSTPLFIVLSIATGSILFVAMWLVGRLLEPLLGAEASTRRLQRRLERRLARGEDRYFEELRSIETAIVEQDKIVPRRFLEWPLVATVPLGAALIGFSLLSLYLPSEGPMAPPGWTHRFGMIWLIYLGILNLVDPQSSGFQPRGARIMGATLIALGLFTILLPFI